MDKIDLKIKAKKAIDEVFYKLEEYEERSKKADGKEQEKVNSKISELEKKKEKLKANYDAIEQASEEKLTQAKKTFDESLEDFKSGIKKLTELF